MINSRSHLDNLLLRCAVRRSSAVISGYNLDCILRSWSLLCILPFGLLLLLVNIISFISKSDPPKVLEARDFEDGVFWVDDLDACKRLKRLVVIKLELIVSLHVEDKQVGRHFRELDKPDLVVGKIEQFEIHQSMEACDRAQMVVPAE